MFRGSTPTHTYVFSEKISDLANVQITYAQQDAVKIVKYLADCTIVDPNTLTVKLTQQETLSLSSNFRVEIQVKALSNEGEVLLSDIIYESARKCLNDEVIQ